MFQIILFFWTFHLTKNPENKMYHSFHKYMFMCDDYVNELWRIMWHWRLE